MITSETITRLSKPITVSLNDLSDDQREEVKKMYKNNLRYAHGRSKDVVKRHTIVGYLSEHAVRALLPDSSVSVPIVDDHTKLDYRKLKSDLRVDGDRVEIKSFPLKWGKLLLSDAQFGSMSKAVPHNDWLLIIGYNEVGNNKYNYKPLYLVDMKRALDFIKPVSGYEYSSMHYDLESITTDAGYDLRGRV